MRGRVVLDMTTREMRYPHGDRGPDALEHNETIVIAMPAKVEALVYESVANGGWVSHVIVRAKDIETGEDGYFGSEWRWPDKPTREQIREHVVDMLDHEMRHQLGLEAHPEKLS